MGENKYAEITWKILELPDSVLIQVIRAATAELLRRSAEMLKEIKALQDKRKHDTGNTQEG